MSLCLAEEHFKKIEVFRYEYSYLNYFICHHKSVSREMNLTRIFLRRLLTQRKLRNVYQFLVLSLESWYQEEIAFTEDTKTTTETSKKDFRRWRMGMMKGNSIVLRKFWWSEKNFC